MNNEEQMKAWIIERQRDMADLDMYSASEGWKAATASKQREIDALNQRVLELSAQVKSMHGLLNKLEYNEFGAKRYPSEEDVERTLSLAPPTALEAHDNEVAAKALEKARDHCRDSAEKLEAEAHRILANPVRFHDDHCVKPKRSQAAYLRIIADDFDMEASALRSKK